MEGKMFWLWEFKGSGIGSVSMFPGELYKLQSVVTCRMVPKQHGYCPEAESGIGDPWRALPK